MSEELVNKILLVLRQKPQYYEVLRNIVAWYEYKFKCEKCGSKDLELVEGSKFIYRCRKCGHETMIMGFEAHEVNSMPAYLYKLYNMGILRITYKSRRYTIYMPTDIKAIKKALEIYGKSTKEPDYNKPIKIPKDLFKDLIGMDDVKNTIIKALKSKRPIHILLVGPPATGKSLLMEELWRRIEGAHLILAGTSTKAGIREILAEFSPRLLLIDELDKINDSRDLSVLLSWMEHQRIVIAMRDRYEVVKCKYIDGCKVIAACNTDRFLPPELKSRFIIIRLKPYTREQYINIVKSVLISREETNPELAEYIAIKTADELGTRDPRDAIKIARLATSKEEVDWIINTLKKYR